MGMADRAAAAGGLTLFLAQAEDIERHAVRLSLGIFICQHVQMLLLDVSGEL